jgi:hypothetical protein
MHLAQQCCQCWKHSWNSYCGIDFIPVVTFFLGGGWYLKLPEIFYCLRQTLFLKTANSHSEPNQGKGWVFPFSNRFLFQKLLDREHPVSWSIVMVENPIAGAKFTPFSTHSFT